MINFAKYHVAHIFATMVANALQIRQHILNIVNVKETILYLIALEVFTICSPALQFYNRPFYSTLVNREMFKRWTYLSP